MSKEPLKDKCVESDKFLLKRAKCLHVLKNIISICEQNKLQPSVEMLKEAVQIGFDLLEEVHRNNTRERFCVLLEKVTEMSEKFLQNETGRMSSEHPNEAYKPGWKKISSETGRVTSSASHVHQLENGNREPIVCDKCNAMIGTAALLPGKLCPKCGHKIDT